ncbi:hypothetical protein IQ241_07200 [Romeria aff. gracilis LEGE 07310]|uniref:Uncharacterized protein n=1 Tax=Vasconcelosia minhoensis LEGE 07310 TaxID=915328 RepID=A0A8J7ACD1_9CYAN|nr:Asr1405/Asl0597 family protein [Romeria gracilis]MBE9077084.1 hypothetical protein [Romeria aff. gracilis LEGE 07310]
MESLSPSELSELMQVDPIDRWSIYHRLQELSIPCWCERGQPLRVQVKSAIAALQLWSVTRQVMASRSEQIERLERCWNQPCA